MLACWVVRGRGVGLWTFHGKRTLKSANVVCVYLFVNTYTQNTPVKKRSVVHHLWQKKDKKKSNEKQQKKVSTSFISIQFFSYEFMVVVILWLWILFTWLIGLHRAEWWWENETERSNSWRKEVPPNRPLDSTLLRQLWLQSMLTRAGKNLHSMVTRWF